ncbi:hypothetical protein AGABI1DRAFT_95761 [Agaricus bisporus var. burnettii JB137-S8]|uniref:Uncharacterized protein n=1 Tax=Agaricus bisporus var. burnettii (strain JB137-S8 / ATCC MYA-4627 / FGSC 10392) TaxID=597362 RepID=K5WU38_AGABU|nr:uncharacterized protein AGABI1DRAFT_95761 [Agaricus bisporus var. burnettii JB137-S8]EKM74263.1 hypothetical protein AGABI1DRAFT_95761 [Agaricus bisporus var. burnettii JB137-S8]
MSANTQVAYTQLDEEVSTFYHRYARGKENSALYLAAFGCLENAIPKARNLLNAMSADPEANTKSDNNKKLLIRTRTMFETWQNERDPKYKFPSVYYDLRNIIVQHDRAHGRTKKASTTKATDASETNALPKKRKIGKKVSSPETIEDSDSDASVIVADFNPGNTPLTIAGDQNAMQVDDTGAISNAITGTSSAPVSVATSTTLEASPARASVVSIASDKSIDLPLVSEENLKLCLGGIEGLTLNTKEIHRAFMANAPLEARQYQLLSNSDHLLKMANELEALSRRYYSAMTNQKVTTMSDCFHEPFFSSRNRQRIDDIVDRLIQAVDTYKHRSNIMTPHQAFTQEIRRLLATPQFSLLEPENESPPLAAISEVAKACSDIVDTFRLVNMGAREVNSSHPRAFFQELQSSVVDDMMSKTHSFGKIFEHYRQSITEFLWLEMMISKSSLNTI